MLCAHSDQNSPCQRRSAYPMPTRVNRGQRKRQPHCVSANRCAAISRHHGLQEWFRLDSSMLPARHPMPPDATVAYRGIVEIKGPTAIGFLRAGISRVNAVGHGPLSSAATASPIRTHHRARPLPDRNGIRITRRNGGIGGPCQTRTDDIPLAGRVFYHLN